MVDANPHRGEVKIELLKASGEGIDHLVLRPTFAAIVEVEEALGTGMAEIVRRFLPPPKFGIRDVAAIIYSGLKAAGHRERRDVVEQRVMLTGFFQLHDACFRWCEAACTGGQDPQTPSTMIESQAPTADIPPSNGSEPHARPSDGPLASSG
jgi:hypothetical protein